MSDKTSYRELEHTGDLAIEVTAPSREALVAEALVALSQLMVDEEGIQPREQRTLAVTEESDADAIREILAAALNLFLIDGFIWRAATVAVTDRTFTASLEGETFDRTRHHLLGEIKAVTYHRLAVDQTASGWRAVVVFDA
ncbi:MAG TPA: archease [Candidatus Binataceae bacterium]|nr:archease [Candidatus Binataceae bacterium]